MVLFVTDKIWVRHSQDTMTILCQNLCSNVQCSLFFPSGDLNYSSASRCQGIGLTVPVVNSLDETKA